MQLVMPFASSVSFEPADFIRGSANDVAFALVERWPDWPYSVVLLHGPAGSGKTHLTHVFAARSKATRIAAERLGQQTADQMLTGNHAWILEDIDKGCDAAALAQLMNLARARGDYMLLTASAPAASLPIALPDLRSRLLALPDVALGAPDDALLMGVLAKQFSDRQLRVTPEVLQYAVTHLERSFAAAKQFADALDHYSLAHGRGITLPVARALLQEIAAGESR